MPVSVRTRFEIFKRDDFQCRYCGRRSPEVVLEVDHIVPACDGGDDDLMNLATSCWACNRGKAGVPLSSTITGEDPHDRAVLLLEQDRQMREYNAVATRDRMERERLAEDLLDYWCEYAGCESVPKRHYVWLLRQLEHLPAEWIRACMLEAIDRGFTKDWRYVMGIVRNHRQEVGA